MAQASRAQQLRDLLEDAITAGRFTPGERLDPDALAVGFQCSRTPSTKRSCAHWKQAKALVPKRFYAIT